MKMLVRFLVYELNTIDGNRDSAQGLINHIWSQNKNEK
jgi:hypothetical protein